MYSPLRQCRKVAQTRQPTFGIMEIQRELQNAKEHFNKNQQVKNAYDDAVAEVGHAREPIHRRDKVL